jgi:hypothetical protein
MNREKRNEDQNGLTWEKYKRWYVEIRKVDDQLFEVPFFGFRLSIWHYYLR